MPQNSDIMPKTVHDAAALGWKLGLERVARLCVLLGEPQNRVPAVHVAGTNGKGSVTAMLANIFAASGLKTGLYQSPYIHGIDECLSIDGVPISAGELAAMTSEMDPYVRQMAGEGGAPSQFEIETALAFQWFIQNKCDIAVIETGLGGRLDATNVIAQPLASVITSISLDHVGILGDTIGKIAVEKCGIIKPGGVTVAYPAQQDDAWRVIRSRAAEEGNTLLIPDTGALNEIAADLNGTDIEYRGLPVHIPMIGHHQIYNAATAIEAVFALRVRHGMAVPDAAIIAGIGKTRVPLRQEWIAGSPGVLLDGAHNPDGLAALADTMLRHFNGVRVTVVMGMLADKDCEASIARIASLADAFVACTPHNPRALSSGAAAEIARRHCAEVTVNDDIAGAVRQAAAYAGPGGAVVVCGSLYLAGPARQALAECAGSDVMI